MSVNSRHTATKITGQQKAFYRQRIPDSSCERKETVDIDTLSHLGMVTKKLCNQNNKQNSLKKREIEPVQPVLKNIYHNNTYRKYLSWPHFNDEPRVQEKKQVKDQQSCIFVFAACLTIPSNNWGHQPRRDNSIPYIGVW